MRNAVRKSVGVALIGLLGALALPMLAAGAQEGGAPVSPGACSLAASGTAPGPVTGTVTVPSGATQVLVIFTPSEGDLTPQPHPYAAPAGGGVVDFSFDVTVPGLVSANYLYGNQNAYATTCTGPGGVAAIEISRPRPAAAPAAQALAFTGSSDTPSYVLIGIAAIVVGAVLVVAARRRSQVS